MFAVSLLHVAAPYVLANLITSLCNVLYILVLTRLLSPETYGIYIVAITVIGFIQTLGFYWLLSGIIRFYSPGHELQNQVLAQASLYGFAIVSVASCGAAIVVGCLSNVLNLATTLSLSTAALLALLFRSWYGMAQQWRRVLGRPWAFVGAAAFQALGGLALAAIGLLMRPGEPAVPLLAIGLASLLSSSLGWALPRPTARLHLSKPLLAQMWTHGAPTTLAVLALAALATADRLLITHSLGPAAAGAYSVSYGLANTAVTLFLVPIALAAKPAIFTAYEQQNAQQTGNLLRQLMMWIIRLGLPITTFLLFAPSLIIETIAPGPLGQIAAKMLPWTACAALLAGFLSLYINLILQATHRTNWMLLAVAPAVVVNLGCNFFFLPTFGLVAAGWSTVAGYAVAIVLASWPCRQHLQLTFLFREAAWTILACLPAAAVLHSRPSDSFAALLFTLSSVLIIYIASLLLVALVRGLTIIRRAS